MSELRFHETGGSSVQGLTFVRPLPHASHAPSSDATDPSSQRKQVIGLNERLFPPRSASDSGVLPPVAGLELGHFILEERIGRGGMGAVFRAIDKRLDRVVALKVLSPEHSNDPDAVHRFQNEARAAARLDHDNIARVFYTGSEASVHFIAFEFVTGINIRTLISQKGKLSPELAVNYTLQIAEALQQTHAANVVHRDIKPSNIIVSPTGQAKLVDLGLARNMDSQESRDLTVAGTALGTFDYIAPEQAMDARNVDVRSDIYSLGCSLYHMLTGAPPYPTGTMFEKVMNHHRPVPPDPAQRASGISPQFSKVVQKMMAANPDERYSTPNELIADLIPIAQSLGLEPAQPNTVIWTAIPSRRERTRWDGAPTWAAVALLLVLLVFADRMRLTNRTTPVQITKTELGETANSIPQLNQNPDATATDGRVTAAPVPTETMQSIPVPPIGDADPLVAANEPTMGGLQPSGTSQPSGTAGFTDKIKLPEFRLHNPSEMLDRPFVNQFVPTLDRVGQSPSIAPGTSAVPALGGNGTKESGTGSMIGSAPASTQPITPGSNSATNGGINAPAMPTDPKQQPAQPAIPPAVTEPFVAINSETEERFPRSTLASAVAIAKDGWVIEIQDTSLPLVLQEPLTIADKKLLIRPAPPVKAGKEYRPQLKIDLTGQPLMGASNHSLEVFLLSRGTLELSNVDIEMQVDPASIVEWSLFSLVKGSQLTTNGVTLTLVNPFNQPATVVSLPKVESEDLADTMPERMMIRPNRIEMNDTFVRGQYDFLTQEAIDPLEITLRNTAVAISGWMFKFDGSNSYMISTQDDSQREVVLKLDQTTMLLGGGLINATSGEHGTIPQIRLDLNSVVVRIDHDGQPLIELASRDEDAQLREALEIETTRNRSFFQMTGPLCLIDSSTSLLLENGRELSAEQLGLTNAHISPDVNLLVPLEKIELNRWSTLEPHEMELRAGDDNPAIGASSNLKNAGVDWQSSHLPRELGEEPEIMVD
ncbi:protein kinase domain-containing protein [Planctomicrobium sp. SH527]|uniref:serine/threonine protein kinase n=1 Tax=Planctomicrobium sp. SH527 TaxID=3448123 RepID=UPI003F5B449D